MRTLAVSVRQKSMIVGALVITYWISHVAPPFRPGHIDPDSVGPGGGGGGTVTFLVIAGLVVLVTWMTKKDSRNAKRADLESQRFYQDLEDERRRRSEKPPPRSLTKVTPEDNLNFLVNVD